MDRGALHNYANIHKIANRQICIIDQYRELTGNKSIPKDRFFISLCNKACEPDGKVIKGSEYDHITLESKLCTPSQYIGIDKNKKYIDINKQLEGRWIHNYFSESLLALLDEGIVPGIVNFDSTKIPTTDLNDIRDILISLSMYDIKDCMVSYTGVNKFFRNGYMSDVMEFLSDHPMSYILRDMEHCKDAYTYGAPAKMSTIWFYL